MACDRVKVILVRDGSAILFSEFGQQSAEPGDVIRIGAETRVDQKGSEQSGGSSSEPFKCTTASGLMLTFSNKAHVARLLALGKSRILRASRHDRRSDLVKILHGVVACMRGCGARAVSKGAGGRQRHRMRADETRSAPCIVSGSDGGLLLAAIEAVRARPAQREAPAGTLHHEFDRLMAAETDELSHLTAHRDKLKHEQDRLLQAHYADAIPLSVLKREQDRILGELDQVERRLDAHHGEYTDARAHLDDALNLLENCADICPL